MPLFIIIAIVVGWFIVRRVKDRSSRSALQWVETREVQLPPDFARDALSMFLSKLGYLHRSGENGIRVYFCGDVNVTCMPCGRVVSWGEFPRVTAAGVAPAVKGVVVTLVIQPLPTVKLAPEGVAFFLECAREESDGAFGVLEVLMEDINRERQRTKTARSSAPAQPLPTALPADLATLGVGPGASWDEVQAAYRDACNKYHPDRLSGQNVAPHLADLAVRRFTEVSAAYERLRSNRPADVKARAS